MDSWIIFADIYIHLQSFFHQKLDVEVVDRVYEWELAVIICINSLSHLSCLSVMVIEVNSHHGNQGSVFIKDFCKSRNLWEAIYIEFCIFYFEIKDIFIVSDLWFVSCDRKLACIIWLFRSPSVRRLCLWMSESWDILLKVINSFCLIISSAGKLFNFGFGWSLNKGQSSVFSIIKDGIFPLNVALQFQKTLSFL